MICTLMFIDIYVVVTALLCTGKLDRWKSLKGSRYLASIALNF